MDHLYQLPEDTGWADRTSRCSSPTPRSGSSQTSRRAFGSAALVGCAVFRSPAALDDVDLRPGRMTASDVLARARAQADAGVQHLIVNMPEVSDIRHLELIGREVVPAIEAIAP
jgi:hypothetical protein